MIPRPAPESGTGVASRPPTRRSDFEHGQDGRTGRSMEQAARVGSSGPPGELRCDLDALGARGGPSMHPQGLNPAQLCPENPGCVHSRHKRCHVHSYGNGSEVCFHRDPSPPGPAATSRSYQSARTSSDRSEERSTDVSGGPLCGSSSSAGMCHVRSSTPEEMSTSMTCLPVCLATSIRHRGHRKEYDAAWVVEHTSAVRSGTPSSTSPQPGHVARIVVPICRLSLSYLLEDSSARMAIRLRKSTRSVDGQPKIVKRCSGQILATTSPTISLPEIVPKYRLSSELDRLSPITK